MPSDIIENSLTRFFEFGEREIQIQGYFAII